MQGSLSILVLMLSSFVMLLTTVVANACLNASHHSKSLSVQLSHEFVGRGTTSLGEGGLLRHQLTFHNFNINLKFEFLSINKDLT